MNDIDFRISDVSGESYGFKELTLVLNRMLRIRKEDVDIWHPADCVGEVGAASLPLNLGVLLLAAQKRYSPGNNALCHGGNDRGERVSVVIKQVS
jgi:3-oxoacyl-[acyl-carrier-protein] synthase-1